MKCIRISPLISHYIDGELDHQTCYDVEQHLKTCPQCEGTYLSMKKMVSALKALEKIQAPPGFLDSLHERIERDSWIKRLIRFFHMPGNIKYPLDIIALGTTAILVFTVFSVLHHPEQEGIDPSMDTTVKRYDGSAPDRKAGTRPLLSETQNLQAEAADGPVQVALFLGSSARSTAGSAQQKEIPGFEAGRSVSIDSKNLYRVDAGRQDAPQDNRPESSLLPKTYQQSKDLEALLNELIHPQAAEAEQRLIISRALSEINRILLIEDGEILSLEYFAGTEYPEFINIRIPYLNYDSFIRRINDMGKLDISTMSQPAPGEHADQIRIQLIPEGE